MLRTINRPVMVSADQNLPASSQPLWKRGGAGGAIATAGARPTTLRAAATAPVTPVAKAMPSAARSTFGSRWKSASGNW